MTVSPAHSPSWTAKSHPQFSVSRSHMTDYAIPNANTKGQDLSIESGTISISSAYSQGGESGDLRLGIRRAARPRNGLPESIIKTQYSGSDVLSAVATVVSAKSTFHVFYSPRASHVDFVVPYQKYMKSINSRIPVGTRF